MSVDRSTVELYFTIVSAPALSRLPDRLWRRYVELRLMALALDSHGVTLPTPLMIAYQLGIPLSALLIDLQGLREEGLLIDTANRFEIAVPEPIDPDPFVR